jgi:flagellar basal-body rod protein FlgB
MFDKLTGGLEIHTKALVVRAERQRMIASNIANADTPGYVGQELNFKEAMSSVAAATADGLRPGTSAQGNGPSTTNARHIALSNHLGGNGVGDSVNLAYTRQTQPSMDGNSVDLDRERASFVDNSVHYEATLRFINSQAKTLLSAIQGQ